MLIATHSLCLKRRGCWTQGSSSHLFWLKQKAPQWLFSETQTEMEMASNLGLDVSGFLLSEKFALLTFGNHTLAFHQGHLYICLWICKKHIFGLPQEWQFLFVGSFYVLCKVGTGPLVFQDNAPWVVSSSQGFYSTVPMLIASFGYGSGEGKIKLRVALNSSSLFSLVLVWTRVRPGLWSVGWNHRRSKSSSQH